jgi:beta-lactamase regulating signal transducer with metallopeptidase domain
MIAPQSLESFTRVGATVLADSVVVGTIIALLACILTLLFRHRSAATRFGVLLMALVAAASLPFVRLALDGETSATAGASLLRVADSWAPWIFWIWAAVASLALGRVGVGIWSLRRLHRTCCKLEATALSAELTDALTLHCPARKVEVLVSGNVAVPAAIGFFRPAVVLPAWLIEEMSPEEVRQVVIHELSHLRRWDDWTNLLQQIVKALFFFHPAVWWMENRLSLEREMACDDAVLMRSANPRAYAECLAHIAERSFLKRGLAMAQAAVSRVRQTSHRVARILQFENSPGARNSKFPVAVATLFALAGMGVLGHAPRLLSFDGSGPGIVASVTAPEVAAPTLRPVKAAWHGTHQRPARTELHVQPNRHEAVNKGGAAPVVQPHLLQAKMKTEERAFTKTVLVVVVRDNGEIAVLQVTTWLYSPSQQVRAARRTT